MQPSLERPSLLGVAQMLGIGSLFSFVPLTVLGGILALLGVEGIEFRLGGGPLTGFQGLLASPVVGVLFALAFTVLFAPPIYCGLWCFAKLRAERGRSGAVNGGV